MRHRRLIHTLVITLLLGALAVPAQASVEAADGHRVMTGGRFSSLPGGTGLGYTITGTAVMVRSALRGDTTSVRVVLRGLDANTTYKVHVHNGYCSDDPAGGGHYQNVIGGPVDEYNEIWPVVTTNAAGVGIGLANHDAWARRDARSVVVHWPDDSSVRLACADLE